MKIELETDESWALLSTVVGKLLDEANLGDEDRAAIRRWRSEEMRPGSDAMRTLTQKLNDDLQRLQRSRERSQIQKHDWV